MYRLLLSRRWFGYLALAIVAAVCCLLLARWQWHRREARLERNAIVTHNWNLPPAALGTVVPHPGADLPSRRQWTPVRLQGRYLAPATVLIRNRPLDGEPGYRVLVPLQTATGILYLDRGWLPIGQTGARPDAIPPPPTGRVTVLARLRPVEPQSTKQAPAGQAQSITPTEFSAAVKQAGGAGPVYTGTYAVMATENPPAAQRMPVFAEPELDEGPHLSYAIQWCIFAAMFLGMWVIVVRRELEEDLESDAPQPVRASAPGALRDEDIEDAQVDQLWTDSSKSDTRERVREAP